MERSEKDVYEYLIVDDFFETFTEIISLATAFELKIIDYLKNHENEIEKISEDLKIEKSNLKILFNILSSYDILVKKDGKFSLSKKFKKALKYRDLLEWKLWYTRLAFKQAANDFSKMISKKYFLEESEIMGFWEYYYSNDYSKETYDDQVKWIEFMSVITKYDSPACIKNYNFQQHKNVLDVGGCKGEFALQLCKKFRDINVTVFDLPIVCDVGKEYINKCKEKNRIKFVKGDARFSDLPKGFDLVLFKNTLNDLLNIKDVTKVLKKSFDSLIGGGKLLIIEPDRSFFEQNKILNKDFFHLAFLDCFRYPQQYIDILKEIGFKNFKLKRIRENNYFIIEGEKNKDKKKEILDIPNTDVLLICPKSYKEPYDFMPLSLLSLSKPLLDNGFNVTILDQRYENNFYNKLENFLKSDLIAVGITCMTGPQIKHVNKIIKFIKKIKNIPIVLGGPHATILPKQTLEHPCIDYVIIGDGEIPFLNLIRALKEKNPTDHIKGIGFKKNNKTILTPTNRETDKTYRIPYNLVKKYDCFQAIPMLTSYGCKYNRCAFCLEKILYPYYFAFSPEISVTMIEDALKMKPYLISFCDNDFLVDKNRVNKILSLCEERGIQFRWECCSRIDTVLSLDDEFLLKLKQKGLYQIWFGVESGSKKILKLIKKGITPEMVLKLNQKLKRVGIKPAYSFMSGFPTETQQDRIKTFDIIKLLKKQNEDATILKINNFTPFPRTELYYSAIKNGFIPPQKFEDWANTYYYNKDYHRNYDLHM